MFVTFSLVYCLVTSLLFGYIVSFKGIYYIQAYNSNIARKKLSCHNRSNFRSQVSELYSLPEISTIKIGVLLHPYGKYTDSLEKSTRKFYDRWSESNINNIKYNTILTVIPLPNIYDLNDKRFEKRWLDYMKSELLLSDINKEVPTSFSTTFDILLSTDTGSSEALLRFSESHSLHHIILTDAFDLYTSGERHGRDFRVSKISENVQSVSFLITSSTHMKSYLKLRNTLDERKVFKTYTRSDAYKLLVDTSIHMDNRHLVCEKDVKICVETDDDSMDLSGLLFTSLTEILTTLYTVH